jgi:hypothetical protein
MRRQGKHASITIEELLGKGVFYVSVPRIYKEDLRQLREELRESLETVVEND